MKTVKEIRKAFWDTYPEFKSEYRTKKTQNNYSADIRMSFVDFVDSLHKNGDISEKLSTRVTL